MFNTEAHPLPIWGSELDQAAQKRLQHLRERLEHIKAAEEQDAMGDEEDERARTAAGVQATLKKRARRALQSLKRLSRR